MQMLACGNHLLTEWQRIPRPALHYDQVKRLVGKYFLLGHPAEPFEGGVGLGFDGDRGVRLADADYLVIGRALHGLQLAHQMAMLRA